MLLHYNKERLADIIEKFHSLTGLSISVIDTEYRQIVYYPRPRNPFCNLIQSTEKGRGRCAMSDRALFESCVVGGCAATHRCHAGLCDTAVPIYKEGVLLGFIIFGQVLGADGVKTPFRDIFHRISELNIDKDEAEAAYESLMFFGADKIESAAEIVTLLAKYIWHEHLIEPRYNEEFERLLIYIEENLTEKISVAELCERFHVSQNTLYGYFKNHFSCTVGEYINRLRMKLARELLITTNLPIYDICARVGIDNYQYFCRRFKQVNGQTPLRYRKKYTNEMKRVNEK